MPLLNTADDMRLGDTPVDALYLGTHEVWTANTGDPNTLVLFRGGDLAGTDEAGNAYTIEGSGMSVSTAIRPEGTIACAGGTFLEFDLADLAAIGTGDWCIESWLRVASPGSEKGWFQTHADSVLNMSYPTGTVGVASGEGVYIIPGSGAVNTLALPGGWPSATTTVHVAHYRTGGHQYAAVDGLVLGSHPDTYNYVGTHLAVGGYYSAGYCWQGSLWDFRYSNVARYPTSGTFTPDVY